MSKTVKLAIIICDRYKTCAGGKCFRALRNREGAFSMYKSENIELVGYTTCGGCPGGNIEYAGEEMVRNGAEVIHLATGFLVGYPPCPYLDTFIPFLKARYGVKVFPGTHPIPTKYLDMHTKLGTWQDDCWQPLLAPTMADAETRLAYN